MLVDWLGDCIGLPCICQGWLLFSDCMTESSVDPLHLGTAHAGFPAGLCRCP